MTLEKAIKILDNLAEGIHPETLALLPANDACNTRSAIRALQIAIEHLKSHQHSAQKVTLPNIEENQWYNNADGSFSSDNLSEEMSELDIHSFFTDESMFEYLQEFKDSEFNPTVARLGKCLVGTQAKSVYKHVKGFSFYGILSGLTTYNQIKSTISNFFEKYNNRIEEEYTHSNKPWEEIDFFEQETFNTLNFSTVEQLQHSIFNFPLQRDFTNITSESLLVARKVFPRAYEPWEQEENDLLLKTLRYTNDLDVLAKIFQRGQGAIRSQGQKLLYQIAHVAQVSKASN
jgi:hypothetical protein